MAKRRELDFPLTNQSALRMYDPMEVINKINHSAPPFIFDMDETFCMLTSEKKPIDLLESNAWTNWRLEADAEPDASEDMVVYFHKDVSYYT